MEKKIVVHSNVQESINEEIGLKKLVRLVGKYLPDPPDQKESIVRGNVATTAEK
jgi:hypothetical protein